MTEQRVSTGVAVLIGGLAIAAAIYFQPATGRYRVTDTNGTALRVDTVTGAAVECTVDPNGKRICARVFNAAGDIADATE